MTTEQKISILLRKYGAKSILRSTDASVNGDESTFAPPPVLTSQIYTDIKDLPNGTNPLFSSPNDLTEWPSTGQSVIRKIIRKPLQWIEGTNVFYDPTPSVDPSALVDIISPTQHWTFSPEVYLLDSQSNRYLHRVSPTRCPWVFDYETGCLVFTDGLPENIKAPQFQPPAITCYRYIGRKNASGISLQIPLGPTGPTGPTGETGATTLDSMIWRGNYDSTVDYSVNDTINGSGIIYVKYNGVTGPTPLTPTYFDSITYNELQEGFVPSLCEQYVDDTYLPSPILPYFQTLLSLSNTIADTSPLSVGKQLRSCDQNVNVFNVTDDSYYVTGTPEPFSTRINFFIPDKIEELSTIEMQGSGKKILGIDGLYADDVTINSSACLYMDNCQILAPTELTETINYFANSYSIPTFSKDCSTSFRSSFVDYSTISLYGKSHISSTTFTRNRIEIGDQLFDINSLMVYPFRDRVVHYFEDVEFIDTELLLAYSGRYSDVQLVFNRCSFVESRAQSLTAGIIFPSRPYEFSGINPSRYRVSITFIDTSFSCPFSIFNIPDYTDVRSFGSVILPVNISQSQDLTFTIYGSTTNDTALSDFMKTQYSISSTSPRACSNFYYNK